MLIGCSAAGVDAPVTNNTNTTSGGGTNNPSTPSATTGVNDAKVKVLATQLAFPYNVITDGTNVYWIDAETGQVGSVSTSSGATGTYLVGGGVGAGFDIAQDATNLYFVLNNFTLRKVAKTGGAVTTLVAASAGFSPSAVVVANGKLYFGNGGFSIGTGAGSNSGPVTVSPVMSVGITGTGIVPVATSNAGIVGPILVATNGATIYFAGQGSSTGNAVKSVPVAGGAATTLVSGVGAMSAIVAPATGAGAGSVFFAERAVGSQDETLRRITGSTITVLATIITQYATSFAIDDSYVYYPKYDSESGGAVIARQSLTTGTVTILAGVTMTHGIPAGLAVDGVNVYWAAVTGTSGAGQIRSVPKS
jgi:hypothetical protein